MYITPHTYTLLKLEKLFFITTLRTARKSRMKTQRHIWSVTLAGCLMDMKRLFRNLGVDMNSLEVQELFEFLFEEPLCSVGDPGRNLLLVIDGLDESEYKRPQ